jgi:hypothetical protein
VLAPGSRVRKGGHRGSDVRQWTLGQLETDENHPFEVVCESRAHASGVCRARDSEILLEGLEELRGSSPVVVVTKKGWSFRRIYKIPPHVISTSPGLDLLLQWGNRLFGQDPEHAHPSLLHPEPLPLVAPTVSDVVILEPIISHLASNYGRPPVLSDHEPSPPRPPAFAAHCVAQQRVRDSPLEHYPDV